MKYISEQFYNANQSWNFERIVDHEGHKLKVVIRRNAHDAQSYCRIFRYDGIQWQFLAGLPFETLKCKVVSYANKDEKRISLFHEDANELLDLAQKILT